MQFCHRKRRVKRRRCGPWWYGPSKYHTQMWHGQLICLVRYVRVCSASDMRYFINAPREMYGCPRLHIGRVRIHSQPQRGPFVGNWTMKWVGTPFWNWLLFMKDGWSLGFLRPRRGEVSGDCEVTGGLTSHRMLARSRGKPENPGAEKGKREGIFAGFGMGCMICACMDMRMHEYAHTTATDGEPMAQPPLASPSMTLFNTHRAFRTDGEPIAQLAIHHSLQHTSHYVCAHVMHRCIT